MFTSILIYPTNPLVLTQLFMLTGYNIQRAKKKELAIRKQIKTARYNYVCGGGDFSLTSKDFGRMFDHSFSTCAIFCLFVLKWRLAGTY